MDTLLRRSEIILSKTYQAKKALSSTPRLDALRQKLAEDEKNGVILGTLKTKGSKKSLPKPSWLKAVCSIFCIFYTSVNFISIGSSTR